MNHHVISSSHLSITTVKEIIEKNYTISLSEESKNKVIKCRKYLDDRINNSDENIYGINTGFGALHNTIISKDKLQQLQENLVISHACGQGNEIPIHIAKTILLLKIQGLSYGHSAIHLDTLQLLIEFFNKNIIPVIYTQGSLGASGDLAPLAHMSLPLIARGEVYFNNKKQSAKEVLEANNLNPVKLHSKEGLALLNGTQFMQAFGVWNVINSKKIYAIANFNTAVSFDAFNGIKSAFNPLIQNIRKQNGQINAAKNILNFIDGSEIANSTKTDVQDPYCIRCTPQVHGASKDVIDYASQIFENEINAVTDNPTVFPDEDLIISGGNFHGQPIAMALDMLSIAIAELGSISERRIYKLLSGQRNLPPFLVKNSGLNSGFMIAQYTAASIVSQNKQLCTPAVIDTIDSSNGQEDHVSMGANAATKCYQITQNLWSILAIELFTAFQALEFRRPSKSSKKIEEVYQNFRKKIPFIENDVQMYSYINLSKDFILTLKI